MRVHELKLKLQTISLNSSCHPLSRDNESFLEFLIFLQLNAFYVGRVITTKFETTIDAIDFATRIK